CPQEALLNRLGRLSGTAPGPPPPPPGGPRAAGGSAPRGPHLHPDARPARRLLPGWLAARMPPHPTCPTHSPSRPKITTDRTASGRPDQHPTATPGRPPPRLAAPVHV